MGADSPSQTSISVALAQFNATVGDLRQNADSIISQIAQARTDGAQVVVFPELSLSGYPPEDLVMRSDFLASSSSQLERIAASVQGIVALVGFPHDLGAAVGNSIAVLADMEVAAVYDKQLLPNYGVFDERRYFKPGQDDVMIAVDGVPVAITICEDVWADDPVYSAAHRLGARLVLNASASPFRVGKSFERESMLSARADRFSLPVAYCNLIGGQDELVFDGASFVVDGNGKLLTRGPQFREAMVHCSIPVEEPPSRVNPKMVPLAALPSSARPADSDTRELMDRQQEIYAALTVGVRDYVAKNGFPGVLVGVSGGIDSALVLALACDALGSDAVTAVTMPSRFNSAQTRCDADEMIERLGCDSQSFPIEAAMNAFDQTLHDAFIGTGENETEENIQARIRGILLMAMSNKFGSLVLTTGNKSEMAVGYATLYGDMAGGFAPLKDASKKTVFELCRWRNEHTPTLTPNAIDAPIPQGIIDRPPSAELREDQQDEDTLGDYAVLDDVIERYIERDQSIDEIVESGVDRKFAERIVKLIDRAEYKRRQAPPGIKISPRAFGRDRRMPITVRDSYR